MVGVAHYRSKVDEAKARSKQALALLPDTSCPDRMEGRLSYYVSAVYREQKKYGKSEEWLDRCQDVSFIFYCLCAIIFKSGLYFCVYVALMKC